MRSGTQKIENSQGRDNFVESVSLLGNIILINIGARVFEAKYR